MLINNLDSYCHLQPYLQEHEGEFGRGFIEGVKTGANVTPDMLERTIRRRAQINAWCADIFGQYDVLLTPTVPFDGMPAKGPYPTEIDGKDAHYRRPRCVHHPLQHVTASGGQRARGPQRPRTTDGHADRGKPPP